MTTWALVPVKPFAEAKSRLGPALAPGLRRALVEALLSRSLGVLAQVPAVAQVLVISRDPAALALACTYGAHALAEPEPGGLNDALQAGTAFAVAGGASRLLVVPTDLPLLAPAHLAHLLAAAEGSGPTLAIAPDRHATGTNALCLRPPGWLAYAFGPGSFQRHLALAQAAGAEVRVCPAPELALDLDLPEDWTAYRGLAGWTLGPSTAVRQPARGAGDGR
jgi:2-phospho-L-lactate guanylyltransferase